MFYDKGKIEAAFLPLIGWRNTGLGLSVSDTLPTSLTASESGIYYSDLSSTLHYTYIKQLLDNETLVSHLTRITKDNLHSILNAWITQATRKFSFGAVKEKISPQFTDYVIESQPCQIYSLPDIMGKLTIRRVSFIAKGQTAGKVKVYVMNNVREKWYEEAEFDISSPEAGVVFYTMPEPVSLSSEYEYLIEYEKASGDDIELRSIRTCMGSYLSIHGSGIMPELSYELDMTQVLINYKHLFVKALQLSMGIKIASAILDSQNVTRITHSESIRDQAQNNKIEWTMQLNGARTDGMKNPVVGELEKIALDLSGLGSVFFQQASSIVAARLIRA